jgi:putative tricarboxylic transport membrane protein
MGGYRVLSKNAKSYNRKDFISSISLLVLGLLLFGGSIRLSVWTGSGPQEGFFPLIIALIIIPLSLWILARELFLMKEGAEEFGSQKKGGNTASIAKVSFYAIAMLLYWVLMPTVGFVATSALFLLFILRFTERQSWKITLWVGIASILTSYLLFIYFLKVPLPKGFLTW